jgi:hypothetical protein
LQGAHLVVIAIQLRVGKNLHRDAPTSALFDQCLEAGGGQAFGRFFGDHV